MYLLTMIAGVWQLTSWIMALLERLEGGKHNA